MLSHNKTHIKKASGKLLLDDLETSPYGQDHKQATAPFLQGPSDKPKYNSIEAHLGEPLN